MNWTYNSASVQKSVSVEFGTKQNASSINVHYSAYDKEIPEPDSYLFENEETARSFMRDAAKKLYYIAIGVNKNFIETEENKRRREKTPPTDISRHYGPYWHEKRNSIYFTSDNRFSQSEECAWGIVSLLKVTMDRA